MIRARGYAIHAIYGLACLGLTSLTLTKGRFPSIDDVFFKAAGHSWALESRFAAPELRGFPVSPPVEKIFAVYPPVYSLLFGYYTKLVGFGWRQVAVFDVLIHIVLTLLACAVILRLSGRGSRASQISLIAALCLLPLGTLGRPDELSICACLFAFLVASAKRFALPLASTVCGILIGVAFTTSLFGGLIGGICLVATICYDLADRKLDNATFALSHCWQRWVPSLSRPSVRHFSSFRIVTLSVNSCNTPICMTRPFQTAGS